MSMRNYANYGHLVLAIDLADLLPLPVAEAVRELISEGVDPEEIQEIFNRYLPGEYPRVELVPMSDVESDDVEEGKLYAYFYEDDLYVKRPSAQFVALAAAGIHPKPCRWVTWG